MIIKELKIFLSKEELNDNDENEQLFLNLFANKIREQLDIEMGNNWMNFYRFHLIEYNILRFKENIGMNCLAVVELEDSYNEENIDERFKGGL